MIMSETAQKVGTAAGGFLSSLGKTAAGAAVGTLGDIAVSALNNYYNKRAFNREVAQEQRTYDRNRRDYLSDLESERAYNSPSSQLARLREAGLNPNLMGEGSLSTGVSSGAQVMGNGTGVGIGPATVNNGLGSGMIAMSTADVARSRADAQNASDYAYADLQGRLAVSEETFRPLKVAIMRAQEETEKGNAARANAEASKALMETAKIEIEKNNADEIGKATIASLRSEADYFSAQGKLAAAKAITEALVQDYQRVQNNWSKVNQWKSMVLDVLGVAGQFVSAGATWKIAMNMASKALPASERGNFTAMFDDVVDQTMPQSPIGSSSPGRNEYMYENWSPLASGLD